MSDWVMVGPLSSLEDEDVTRFDHAGRSLAIYRVGETAYATDDFCTHEKARLSEGLLLDCVIECPKHNGRFDIRTGRAISAPARIALKTYKVKIRDGIVYVKIDPVSNQS
jgi:3-phenylpropionate/trans-cinnamate dioxygenase ferredoxin subunit